MRRGHVSSSDCTTRLGNYHFHGRGRAVEMWMTSPRGFSLCSCIRQYTQGRYSRAGDFRIDATDAVIGLRSVCLKNQRSKCGPKRALSCLRLRRLSNPTAERRCILVATNAWHRPFASLLRRPLGVVVRAAEER